MFKRPKSEYSDGEMKLFLEIQRRGLNLICNFGTHRGVTFDVTEDGVKGTEIDFLWGSRMYAVYLDGEQVHKSNLRWRKDHLVVAALERRGWTVDRFRYKPPLPNYRLKEIMDQIESYVRKKEVR